jgi:hypothetical protein
MCKNTVATEKGACTPSSSVLPTDFETPKEGSWDSSGESAPPDNHDQLRHLVLHNHLILQNKPRKKERSGKLPPYACKTKERREEKYQRWYTYSVVWQCFGVKELS